MFLLLILLIQSRQQQNVIKSEKQIAIQSNVNTVIETFEGTVLQERIEFENDFRFPNPCKLKQHPFQLTYQSESQFNTMSFINGTLDQQILQQITIAQVGLGVMVLKNAGHLLFYNVQENLILRSNHEYPELSNVSTAVIGLINEKLIILTDQKSWILSPNFSDEDIFDQKYLEEIEISQVNKKITRSHQVDDYLYILYEEVGLRVFKFYKNKLNQILQLNQSIFDFSVIEKEGNHILVYLEKNSGLQFSQLNLKTNVFQQISEINLLYNVIQGNGLNVYKNQLLIFNNNSTQSSCLSLYLFDIEQSTLNKIGTQHFKDQILSVKASGDLILVFGQNVHFTLSWSVFYNPKQSNTTYFQQFILPGLKQQIFKINEKKKQMVIGITNNTLTVIEIHHFHLITTLKQ